MKYRKHNQGMECDGCNDRLKDAHPDIVSFFRMFKHKYPDMHTSCVHRDEDDQNDAYRSGASKLKFPKSKHNLLPARAIDIFQIDPLGHGVFDPGFCRTVDQEMQNYGFDLRWGGTFRSLGDYCHFELRDDE